MRIHKRDGGRIELCLHVCPLAYTHAALLTTAATGRRTPALSRVRAAARNRPSRRIEHTNASRQIVGVCVRPMPTPTAHGARCVRRHQGSRGSRCTVARPFSPLRGCEHRGVRVIEQQDSFDGRRLPANMNKRVLCDSVTKYAIVKFICYLCFINYLFL